MIPRSEVQIQGTSDSCTLSKHSMSERGYLIDPYIKYFVNKNPRRSPLINLGYFTRAVVVNDAIKSFLALIGTKSAQIISCGAGFDTSYFVLVGSEILGPNIVYFEVDYPDVVRRKTLCIRNSLQLRKLVGDDEDSWITSGINGKQYKLIGCDLKRCDEFSKNLRNNGIDFSLPTFFFSECAITYMEEKDSSQLIKWAANNFENASFVNYEQIHPDDGFGLVMTNHFKKLHSPLQSVSVYPNISSQMERYTKLGWSSCSSKSVMDIYFQIVSGEEQVKILSLEPFDEFEEWHLKCSHYSLSVATKGTLANWKPLNKIVSFIPECDSQPRCSWTLMKADFRRYYHAASFFSEDELLVVGGFGPLNNGANSRISAVSLVKFNDFKEVSHVKSLPLEASPNVQLARVHHSCNTTSNGQLIVYGGRTSPLKPLSSCLILTLKKNNDSLGEDSIKVEEMEHSQNVPPPRWRFSAVMVKYDGQEELVVFGGRANCLETLGDLWVLNVRSLTWREEKFQSSPEPRFSHSAAVWGSERKMLITGGMSTRGNGHISNAIWSWDYINKRWEQIKLFGEPTRRLPRYGHSSMVITDTNGDDLLIMVGGINTFSGQQSGIGIFNLQKRIFTEFALPVLSPECPILLFNHTCHVLPGKMDLLVLGGGGTCFSFGTSFNHFVIKINLQQFF